MPARRQIDPHLLAIEVNALRMAEIATLRRECAFWRQRCLHLEAVADLRARDSVNPAVATAAASGSAKQARERETLQPL